MRKHQYFYSLMLLLGVSLVWGIVLVQLFDGWGVFASVSGFTRQPRSQEARVIGGAGQGVRIANQAAAQAARDSLQAVPPTLLLFDFKASQVENETVAAGRVMSISPAPLFDVDVTVELRDSTGNPVTARQEPLSRRMLYGDRTAFVVHFPKQEKAVTAHAQFARDRQLLPHVQVGQ